MNSKVKLLGLTGMMSLMLVSCSKDEMVASNPGDEIVFNTHVTRATETTTQTLTKIRVYADAAGYDEMFIKGDVAEKKGDNGYFQFAKNYYWPNDVKTIRFWSYGPADIFTEEEMKTHVQINAQTQQFLDCTPKSGVDNPGKDHKDLVVAYTSANRYNDPNVSGSNVNLAFHHAFTQVVVNAKNGGAAAGDDSKTVKIKGAWIVNVKPTGNLVFTEDAVANNYMSWSAKGEKTYYGLSYADGQEATLSHTYVPLIGADNDNSSLMLIPQDLDKWNLETDKANSQNGAYILLLCRIEIKHAGAQHPEGDASNDPVHSEGEYHYHQLFPVIPDGGEYNANAYGYTCVPIDTKWLPGKKYVYNLEFCGTQSGAGIYPPTPAAPFPLGDDVITEIPDGKNIGDTVLDDPISFTVTLEEWTDAGVTETPEVPVP